MKIKKVILAFSILFLFSACGKEEVDRSKYPYKMEMSGILQAEEIKPDSFYTYSLEDEDGNFLFALKNGKLNLNKYEEEEVIVSGNVDLAKDDKTEILLVKEIELTNPPIEDLEYNDEKLEISFIYPSSLEIVNYPTSLRFLDKDKAEVTRISKIDLNKNKTNLENQVSAIPLEGTLISETPILINSIKAIRRNEKDGQKQISTVFFLGHDNFYILKFLNPESKKNDNWQTVFDNLVDSFNANDLNNNLEMGEFCGGTLDEECPENMICLLDTNFEGSGGTCINPEILENDKAMIKTMCNNSQGFMVEMPVYCKDCNKDILPTCECGDGRVWDEINGCIKKNLISDEQIIPTEENTTKANQPKIEIQTEVPITGEEGDNFVPSSMVPGDMREMEATAWGYKMSYPKNWYYMGTGGGSYYFSNDPDKIVGTNTKVSVSLVENCAPDTTTLCRQISDKTFQIIYNSSYQSEASAMLNSISLIE